MLQQHRLESVLYSIDRKNRQNSNELIDSFLKRESFNSNQRYPTIIRNFREGFVWSFASESSVAAILLQRVGA